jgi:hypothetical protein
VADKHIDIPDAEAPNLGDILGICKLIDSTAKSYAELAASNVDPNDPELPRLRMVGGVFMRVPHKALYRQLFEPSYRRAKTLGYRGTLQRWGELLQEAADQPQSPPPAK